jgi:hypothetical protein
MGFKLFLSLMVHRKSKNAAFGQQKGQIHRLGFTPLSCDIYRISKEFSDLISTVLLEVYQVLAITLQPQDMV